MTLTDDEAEAFRHVLSIPQGRLFVLWVLKQCPVYSTSYDEASGSVSAFAEGNRNVGLKLIRAMGEINPMLYPQLLIDHVLIEEAEASREPREQERDDDGYDG